MNVTFLADREKVIEATIDISASANSELMGMGRQIAWIEIEPFERALEAAVKRNVTVRVIGVSEGEVKHFASCFERAGAHVKFYDHGDIRVALADARRAVLAFPLPCTGLETRRRYVGLFVEDEVFGKWLKARFDEIWDIAAKPSDSFRTQLITDFRKSPAGIVAGLIGALLGAIATLATLWLSK